MRNWLAQTFYGLTWGRFAIFCVVVELIALHRGPSLAAILRGVPWMPGGAVGLAIAFFHAFLGFIPVLLCVVGVENRGPREPSRRIWWFAIAVVVGQIIGTFLYTYAIPYLYPDGFLRAPKQYASDIDKWRVIIGTGLVMLVYSAVATGFFYFFRRDEEMATSLHRETMEQEQLDRANAEAQLQVMQAQIEPHFIFNALASVRRLYEVNQASGQEMLRHLARYLTASLPGMRESRPTLARELALVLAYLEVQKIRMGPRLSFGIEVPDALKPSIVPPMMLATLVENAVIHGVSPLSRGGHIRIAAHAEPDTLVLEVADNGKGLEENWGGGVGLANIRARLASAFGTKARLVLTPGRESGVTATIRLPRALSGAAGAA